MFRRAQRRKAKLRLALMGPAGSGKTFSALMIAKGLGGRVAIIDTERGSGELYSHLYEYDATQLEPPFSPSKYIQALRAAEQAGYDVIIVDSLSHAWAGPGGVLDLQDKAAKSTRNSFSAWREVTPLHNELVDALLGSTSHLIVTMRTKTSYEVQQDGGKTKVMKVGLAPVQRDGLEYEFTVVLDLSIDGHVATATKDRTGLFDGQYFSPSEEIGNRLSTWLNSGELPEDRAVATQPKPQPEKPRSFLHEHLHKMLEAVGLLGYLDLYSLYVCTRYDVPSMDQLAQKQLAEQLTMLRQIKDKKTKFNQFVDILNQQRIAA